LVSDLKKTEIEVWYDLSGLEGGSRWGMEIQNALQNSDYVIVVLSPDSVESEWVEREYLFASNLKKRILPLMYRECNIPLSFLNLNYVDVRGENYVRNFEKITRFLYKESLPSSASERSSGRKSTGVVSYALLGVVAVVAATAVYFLLNGRENNVSPGAAITNTPVQESIRATSTSDTAIDQPVAMSTPMQPDATSTQPVPTLFSMVTSVPTQVNLAGQTAFVEAAESENMSGHVMSIKHPLSSDPNVLVFAMSNYNSPASSRGIYNRHLIGVWYTGTQWTVLNQDMGFMPQSAAFNIQILSAGGNAFIHTATSSNTKDNWTAIDNPLASDPNALVFAIPNWSPPDGSRKTNSHPIGVWYTGKQWAIFNEDRASMREGAAFNVEILRPSVNAFVHTATSANTKKNWTAIENPEEPNPLVYDSNALIFVMPRSSPGEDAVYNNEPIGVWHNGEQWTIFNQNEGINMPEGAQFNVLILQASQ
jgi:hypothetical protein